METFIRRLIDEGSRQRLPELLAAGHADALYHVRDRSGVAVIAVRTTCLREEQLVRLLKFRWAQYLDPAVNIHSARIAYERRQEHEPLSEVLPDDIHVIAGTSETGQILCYAVFRSAPPAPPGTTLRTRDRPLFQVEKFHGWGIYNRLPVLPDLPLTRLRELGRFVKNQQLHTFDELGARSPVEVGAAVLRLLLGPLRPEVDALVGDLEEGVSKQNLEFFHVPTLLIRGTVPYEPEDGIAFPRYQYRTIYPVAMLIADIERTIPRLEAIEGALSLPGKKGLLALFDLKQETRAPKSSLEPPGGLPPLSVTEVPQPELPMPQRREMLDVGAHLRATELFRGLSVAEAALLGSFLERREVPAGTVLLRQGEHGDDLYLIESGEVEVRLRRGDGPALVLARRGPGDMIGEMALLTGAPRSADVVALAPMTARRLSRANYTRFLARLADVELQITRTVVERTTETARAMIQTDGGPMSIPDYRPNRDLKSDPEAFAAHLDRKVAAVLAEVEQSEVYRVVADPSTDGRLIAAIVKYVLLEVFSYGPHVTEATFTAIGRLPKTRPDLMKPMLLHDLAEVDHGEMALRDFIKLGGDEAWARSRRITPASFAMSATCRMLGEREDPFSYLRYRNQFESLTPTLTARTLEILKARGFPVEAQTFIDVHATEDIAHSSALRNVIVRVVKDYPEAAAAIEYGLDCFSQVYPLPIWKAALEHARAEAGTKE